MKTAKIRAVTVDVLISGTTGSANTPVIDGRLLAVHLDYESGTNATTDVTISRATGDLIPAETLLTVSNNATSGWYRPRASLVDSSGAAISGGYDTYGISGQLTVAAAQSTDAKTITATFVFEAM